MADLAIVLHAEPVPGKLGAGYSFLGPPMKPRQIGFAWADLEAIWQVVTAAFAVYGKAIRPLKGTRRDHLTRLVAEGYAAHELAAAVHGYVHWHKGLHEKGDGFDPYKWFTPETVFGPEKLEARIEFGMAGPFISRQERAAVRVNQAELERQREIAKVREERKLRAV